MICEVIQNYGKSAIYMPRQGLGKSGISRL